LFLAAGIVVAGYLSDARSPRCVLMLGCALTVPTGLAMAPLFASGSLFAIFAFLALALFWMGLVYGPLGAFLPALFPARVRYTGASLAFNAGGILGGALAPMIAQALSESVGLFWVGVYLSGAALTSLVALVTMGEGRGEVG
jgi:MFS family permease